MKINFDKAHRTTVKTIAAASLIYALTKAYALSTLLHSIPIAAGMNATLIGLNLFFLLCAWFLVKQQPGMATFAAVGSVLTALMV